jgi:hypothetical protein
MTHPDYEKIGTPEDKLIEECAELIKAIMKARRFGYFGSKPSDPKKTTNIDLIRAEMNDVQQRLGEYKKHLNKIARIGDLRGDQG